MKQDSVHALSYLDFRQRLRDELSERQAKKKDFSLRSFARFLKIDAPTLQKILLGKRALGLKSIRDLGGRLGLSKAEIEKYELAHRERRRLGTSLDHDKIRAAYQKLSEEFIPLISRWEVYAILELVNLPVFRADPNSISRALRVPREKIDGLLADLTAVGWLAKRPDGTYHSNAGSTSTDPADARLDDARRQLMQSIIQKSLLAYERVPPAHRLHYARTLTFDRSLLGQIGIKVRNFSEDLKTFIKKNTKNPNDVYQLQLGFYPLTEFFRDSD